MTAAAAAHDPARHSYYVDDALYQMLVTDFATLRSDARALDAPEEQARFRAILEHEARLLDQLRFDAWLGLYAGECLYWVPGTPGAGDPRREIAIMFDDRRRLEDRIFRLTSGSAWSQAPLSRTVRMVSNVEMFASAQADERLVRSNFLISEFWDDETRLLSGWSGHRFRACTSGWEITAKQVNLLNCDQCIRNPSIIL